MSLDFYLNDVVKSVKCECPNCGDKHTTDKAETLFSSNITHNLNMMAGEAGIYDCLWRPEENGITYAKQMIAPLEKAIYDMKARACHYKQFNAKNGWGTYEHFVPWVEGVLRACKQYPEAEVSVSR